MDILEGDYLGNRIQILALAGTGAFIRQISLAGDRTMLHLCRPGHTHTENHKRCPQKRRVRVDGKRHRLENSRRV